MNSNFKYVVQGLNFLSKNFQLVLITVVFYAISSLFEIFDGVLFQISSFLFLLFAISFELSVPYLVKNLKRAPLTFNYVIGVILKNAKKIIIPGTFLFVFLVILFLYSGVLISNAFGSSNNPMLPDFNRTSEYKLTIVVVEFLLFPLVFTGIFFSIMNNNLFKAIYNSFKYSTLNLRFLVWLVPLMLVKFLVIFMIGYQTKLSEIITNAITEYFNLVILISCYFYMRDKKVFKE